MPAWHWAYVAFRFADGLSHGLIALAVLDRFHQPIWVVAAVAAAMNLAGVPASFLWAKRMQDGQGRRRATLLGFSASAAALAVLAWDGHFLLFVMAAVTYTAAGTSSAPASSTLLMEQVERSKWGRATASMSRRTGFAYLGGVIVTLGAATIGLPLQAMLLAAAGVVVVAIFVAARTIVPFAQLDAPVRRRFDLRVAMMGQRRFERAVWFPSRMFYRPTTAMLRRFGRKPDRLLAGVMLLFMASVVFFSSYPGVLREHLGFAPAMVLLAQFPANLATPLVYPLAGRVTDTDHGRGLRIGALVRLVALPALCLVLLLGLPLVAILVVHAAMGVGFAFVQTSGPLICADRAATRAEGVGLYHAAVAGGTLLGSLTAAAVVGFAGITVSYMLSAVLAVLGTLLVWTPKSPSPAPAVEAM